MKIFFQYPPQTTSGVYNNNPDCLSVCLSTVNLTLATSILFEPNETGFIYYTCVFFVTRPFFWYQHFYIVTFTLTFDLPVIILLLKYSVF